MSAQSPRPTAHEPESGCSLNRRTFLQTAVATGAIAAGGLASSGTAAAADNYCLGTDNDSCALDGAIEFATGGLDMLFGSDDDSNEELEEYLENEVLRVQGDAYQEALIAHGSDQTTLTWVSDNAALLEGRAYVQGLLNAYDAVENGATRNEAITAGAEGADEIYSVPQRELIEEFHLLHQNWARYVDRFLTIKDEGDVSESMDDLFGGKIGMGNDGGISFSFNSGGWQTSTDGVTYTLFTGEEVTAAAPLMDATGTHDVAGDPSSGPITGLPNIYQFDGTPFDSEHNLMEIDIYSAGTAAGGSSDNDYVKELEIWVDPFDDAEYRNVYDSDFDEVDGQAMFIEWKQWGDAATSIKNAHTTAVSNVEAFVDDSYEAMVDDEITRQDLQTLETRVEDTADEDPLAWVNVHMAMLGNDPAKSMSMIELGERDTASSEYNPDEDSKVGLTIEGTIMLNPAPSEPLEVGTTYVPQDIGENGTNVTLTFSNADIEGDVQMYEITDDRKFTITEAMTVNEDGEEVETDSVTFSDGAPTETPTDYDELEQQMEELNQLQQDLIEQQIELTKAMSEDDDDGPGPLFPENPLKGGGGLLGLGLIGVVILAVIGIVTDAIPGLGEN